MTRILLVRHGQTEWNRIERFRGRIDVPLNETGIAQAEKTARRIAGEWKPAAIYSSPLERAMRTAEMIAVKFDISVQSSAGLNDINYGEWHGLTPEEAQTRWPEIYSAWMHAPDQARIPGGETLEDLRLRGMAAIEEMIRNHPGETVAAVGHTVINRVILLAILGLGNDRFWRIHQDNCAINVFDSDGIDFDLLSLNDTCHLRMDFQAL
ncbi:MAG: histidine phosphatase family protein [Chloroflexi bacterium]|nr:histidine phosphatase family protein [Chloroflexota bacterium]